MSSTVRDPGTRAPRFLPPDPRVEEPYRFTPQLALRIAVLGVLAIVVFAALFFRLWALQVISGERYLEDARNNQIRSFRLGAPRGSIIDRDGDVLVSNMPGTLVQIWPAALEETPVAERDRVLRRLSRLLGVRFGKVKATVSERIRSDPLTPVTVGTDVGELKAAYLMEHQSEFPGIQITETYLRRYEEGSIAAQILGYVSEISAEQLETKEKDGYAAGDRIGQTGIEAAYDTYLRGLPGLGQVFVDALGRVTSEREFSQLPESGDNVRLTIDDELQQTAEEALAFGVRLAHDNGEWAADGGALVAMDVRSGEILALASNPTFDPSVYVGTVEERELERLADPVQNYPTLNRAIAGIYPPGSTFKPITALAALEEGLLRTDEIVQCTGKAVIDGQTFMNWDPFRNEPMTLTTALANSCDTYFYDVALRFYERPDSPLQRWSRRMGFGGPTGIDLGPEEKGLVPTPAWREKTFESEIDKIWTSGDSVQLAIGQGDLLVTPLQMTRAYAMIANGGKLVEPHLVKAVEEPRNEGEAPVVIRPYTPKPAREVGIDEYALQTVQEGLYDATHATYGTSQSVFGAFPVEIAGKTGTAEKFVRLPGFAGLRDQSWWCGYGPYARPEVAVCAVIENGGHGGEAAAPVALEVFEDYFDVEPGSYSASIQESD
ncbi:MAG TPA: penicillin-binding protein 2 [Gaiellaceae bacterium]|nr:penicillin-binding protein 2 [Gaiellaceae bacterium]